MNQNWLKWIELGPISLISNVAQHKYSNNKCYASVFKYYIDDNRPKKKRNLNNKFET